MNKTRLILTVSAVVALLPVLVVETASAGFIEKRYGSGFAVSPAMMHAIDTIVAEKAKMTRHRHHR